MEFELIGEEQQGFFSYARAQRKARERQDPDVGDMVHYFHKDACRAGVVTQDDLTSWQLAFLMPGEYAWRAVREAQHDESKKDGTWHWPCGGH